MARLDRLQPGSLVPAAKPVNQFVNWRNVQAARPTQFAQMGQPSQLRSVGVGSLQNVQGRNPVADLAQALSPLAKLADTGLQMYASGEYKKGQNEVLRASALLNKQMLASGQEYAAQNRDLSRVDPVAAIVMDNGNPYRVAGRKNQASQLAAQALPGAMNQLWAENGSELVKLDPASPKLNEVRAQAIQRVNSQFGLSEMDAGFMDYVLPTLNRAWEQFGQKHLQARTAYLKDTQHRMTSAQLFNTIIGWDGSNMTEDQLMQRLGGILAENASQLGIAGEPSDLERKSLVGLTQRLTAVANSSSPLAGQARRMLGIVAKIPTGQLGAGGQPILAGELYGVEMLEGMDQTASITRRMQDREIEDLQKGFDDKWGSALAGATPGSPEANAILDEALADSEFEGLPLSRRRQILLESTRQTREFGEAQVNETALQQQLEDWESRVGSDWDEAEARKEFQAIINQLPAGATESRKRFRDAWESVRRRKAQEAKGSYNTALINTNVKGAIEAALIDRYPDITAAALQGVDNLEGLLAFGDSQRKAGTQRMSSELRRRIYARLREESAKRGVAELEPDVQQSVIDKVIKEVTSDQTLMNRLLPPLGGQQPQGQGQQPQGQQQSQQPVVRPQTFKPSTLDTAPADVLKGNNPVMSAGDTAKLVTDALNGKSLPAAFKRAAKTAGMTPEQFLLRQADGYPGIDLTPQQRQKLLKQGNQAKGFADGIRTASAAVQGGMTRFVGTLGDILMGTAPAYARTPITYRQQTVALGPGRTSVGDHGGLASLVRSGEGSYNSVNYGKVGGGTMNVTGMTIGQLEKMQARGEVFAVGAYQFTPGPLAQARRDAGLSPNTLMTPEVQDKLFWASVLGGKKRPALTNYLTGKSNNLNAAHQALSLEWAAVQGPSGRGAYDGDAAGNYASLGAARIRQALIKARKSITGGR